MAAVKIRTIVLQQEARVYLASELGIYVYMFGLQDSNYHMPVKIHVTPIKYTPINMSDIDLTTILIIEGRMKHVIKKWLP